MAISVECSGCSRSFWAPDVSAGRFLKCPHCKTPAYVDQAAGSTMGDDVEADEFTIAPLDPTALVPSAVPSSRGVSNRPFAPPTRSAAAALVEIRESRTSVRRLLLFLVAFLPLSYSIFVVEPDVETRLRQTLEENPTVAQAAEELSDDAELDDLIVLLPDQRIVGAHLSRPSYVPWIYAALSVFGFFAAAKLLLPLGRTPLPQLFYSALGTATLGIVMLYALQWIAQFAQGIHLVRGHIVIVAIFWLIKAIGFSYRAAMDPSLGFAASFAGYTFGVGLCEELVKSMPVFFRVQSHPQDDWRDAAAWGFASGIGFGAAEGVIYSADYYDGLAGGTTYLVRFVSCVALHAVWSAAVGVAVWRCREMLAHDLTWLEWIWQFAKSIFVPMVLHGLYDTLLKQGMEVAALWLAALSVAWLAAIWEHTRRQVEADVATAAAR